MSSKIGTILASIFVVFAFLLGCDLISIQYIYSDLDAKSINISYLISRSVTLDEKFAKQIHDVYKVDFYCETKGLPAFGDEINYVISYDYKPLMIANESITVSISRMTIVGFYG